ncbi:MAG: hypothetical protein GVY16_11465 [Planctomycetes bacterium]|jgi:hypothetical protein|nr:hypothetical protein [Planctomycetota bacterium]
MKHAVLLAVVLLGLLLACAPGEDQAALDATEAEPSDSPPPAGDEQADPPDTRADNRIVRLKEVTVDLDRRTVTCPATAIEAQYALEFLLCKRGTKEHESLLATPAEAWQIHAGLLMLGLSPGKPGTYVGEGKHLRYVPPRGPALDIRLKWTDTEGEEHEDAAIDWLKLSGQADEEHEPEHWIFVGSEILPGGGYWADADGGIIAVANLPSAVIDVPFESAQAIEERLFELNKDALAPAGTKVQIVIRPLKGGKTHPHARALLEINRNGEMTIDGEPIAMNELRDWATAWTRQHEDGMVVIRSSALAPGVYADLARLELKVGGVFEFERRVAPLFVPLLPHTPAQVAADLADWQARFAEPKEQLRDPGQEAQKVLRQIELERRELKRLDLLWTDYEKQLRQQLDDYRRQQAGTSAKDASGR